LAERDVPAEIKQGANDEELAEGTHLIIKAEKLKR
jgi:hypothetical protein